jgi:inosine/xanthosine triphosphate pyrophosphatase family protein
MGLMTIPDEAGDTHHSIARTKAMEWSRAASMLVIASDGGLLLPILGTRWESRHTHRFAGPEADNAQRLERLLELMKPFNGDQREASWVEAVAIADQGRLLASWELKGATGIISDSSIDIPPGPEFWAFSVWYFPQLGKTYEQLSLEERERLGDHWARLRHVVRAFFWDYLEQAT